MMAPATPNMKPMSLELVVFAIASGLAIVSALAMVFGELLRAEDKMGTELASAPAEFREFASQLSRTTAHRFQDRTRFIQHENDS